MVSDKLSCSCKPKSVLIHCIHEKELNIIKYVLIVKVGIDNNFYKTAYSCLQLHCSLLQTV